MGKRIEYTGMRDFARKVAKMIPLPGAGTSATKEGRGHDWDLNLGYQGAMDLAMSGGWAEGAAKMAKTVGLAAPFIKQAVAPELELGMTGFLPDVPSYLRGSPCAMYGYAEEDESSRPVVRVGVNCMMASAMEADCAFNRGAAILGIIDELENSGHRVELWAVLRTGGEHFGARGLEAAVKAQHASEVLLKAAGEQWNPASVAFAICHPAFSRRLGFRVLESDEYTVRLTHGGYGGDYGVDRETSDFDVWFKYETDNEPWRTIERAVESAREIFNRRAA